MVFKANAMPHLYQHSKNALKPFEAKGFVIFNLQASELVSVFFSQPVGKIPTGWDFFIGKIQPCLIRIKKPSVWMVRYFMK
ncbi:hypothetical protein [Lacibacter sp.]|uniref:hypothetical protein n=1 Tax=Lacibacter sp. TaxID=1915409 RepID=UPI002B4AFF88|nr:hypothetical protein [Lacibacter sp.]HLP37211.1 hypothetical protein [Lacibacter sp.]